LIINDLILLQGWLAAYKARCDQPITMHGDGKISFQFRKWISKTDSVYTTCYDRSIETALHYIVH